MLSGTAWFKEGQDQVPVEVDVIQECSRESSHSGKRPPVVDVKGHVVGLSWSPQPIAQITLDHPWHPGRNPEERRTGRKGGKVKGREEGGGGGTCEKRPSFQKVATGPVIVSVVL